MAAGGADRETPRFLLDENVDPRVADGLRGRDVDAVAMRDWRDGTFLARPDEEILRSAKDDHRCLVTYDVHTIAPLLGTLAETRESHAGVVFVSPKTIEPSDVGSLVKGLAELAATFESLEDVAVFLSRD